MTNTIGRNVLLIHDGDWGWAPIEQTLHGIPEVTALHIANTVGQAIELVNHCNTDVIIGKPNLNGDSIAPLISELRTYYGFLGQIYLIADKLGESVVEAYAWVGIDGLLDFRDIPRTRLDAFLIVLVSGCFRLGGMEASEAFFHLMDSEWRLPDPAIQRSERQVRLLKAWYRSENSPTYQELANDLGVSASTVKRDIEGMYDKLGAWNRISLGARAMQHGFLP